MTLLSLLFVFVPFISIPGLLSSSTYTQPLPLLLGWIYLVSVFRISARKTLVLCGILFLLYILALGFLFQENFITGPAQQSVFIAYCIGFSSFFLLISLFRSAFQRLNEGDPLLAQKILKSARIIMLIVASASILQLVPAFSSFLSYIKPRHVDLGDASLDTAFRGLSGILPEPSYVGLTISVMFLVVYWFSFRIYIENYDLPLSRLSSLSAFALSKRDYLGSAFYLIYASHFVSFFSSAQNCLAILMSILAVILAFSPTSMLTYGLLLLSLLIPVVLQFLRLKASGRMLILLSFVVGSFVLAGAIAYGSFSGSRFASIINSVGDKGLVFLVSGSDDSSADRSASSISGLFSIFYHPFGLGLNSHGFIFSDCGKRIIKDFGLLCGSVYSSSRNHNALAAFLQDGGIVGIIIALLAFGPSVAKVFPSNFGSFSWVGRLSLLYFLFLFVVLPSPLGAPGVWIALALILSFFSVPLRFGSPDCCPNV